MPICLPLSIASFTLPLSLSFSLPRGHQGLPKKLPSRRRGSALHAFVSRARRNAGRTRVKTYPPDEQTHTGQHVLPTSLSQPVSSLPRKKKYALAKRYTNLRHVCASRPPSVHLYEILSQAACDVARLHIELQEGHCWSGSSSSAIP